MKKTYLGDGLYADFDGYQVVLSASNGITDANTVYLDSDVLKAFLEYIDQLKAYHQNKDNK